MDTEAKETMTEKVKDLVLEVLPAVGTLVAATKAGAQLHPDTWVPAVHKACENAGALTGLDGDAKKAEAVSQLQAVAKDVLDDFLPTQAVNLLVEAGAAMFKLKALGLTF